MEQRRLRLGDILDDYCPRERRVTNHVIVAMVEDDVKQTRCSTCDADHEYKQARVPSTRRKKDGATPSADVAVDALVARRTDLDVVADAIAPVEEPPVGMVLAAAPVAAPEAPIIDEPVIELREDDDGPVHRRLIRATLPRPEGQVPERKETEFTVRQQGGRGREIDGNRPQGQNRNRRPHRSGAPGDTRFAGAPKGNNRRGGGGSHGNGNGRPHQGPPGAAPQGGPRNGGPGGGEGRFRRRRGR
jgi:hypothetical protein